MEYLSKKSVSYYFSYFCGMKKRLLKIGSLLMAILVLFVSVGWDVCFHYCTTSKTLSSRIGMGAPVHAQCSDHSHCLGDIHENNPNALHFEEKGCCEDFDKRIQLTDSFTFSFDKQQLPHFHPTTLVHLDTQCLSSELNQVINSLRIWKVPFLPVGKAWLIFLSNLRLNPLVF